MRLQGMAVEPLDAPKSLFYIQISSQLRLLNCVLKKIRQQLFLKDWKYCCANSRMLLMPKISYFFQVQTWFQTKSKKSILSSIFHFLLLLSPFHPPAAPLTFPSSCCSFHPPILLLLLFLLPLSPFHRSIPKVFSFATTAIFQKPNGKFQITWKKMAQISGKNKNIQTLRRIVKVNSRCQRWIKEKMKMK